MTHEWDITSEEAYADEADFTTEVEDFRSLLGAQIFGATFIKRDGSERTGTFRLRVRKNLTGEGSKYDRAKRGNLTVWDMEKGAYRTIRIEALVQIRFRGTTVNFGDAA